MTGPVLDLYVVDPDERVSATLRPSLGPAGLQLAGTAANADEVMPTIAASCPDVVLLDVSASSDVVTTVRRIVLSCPKTCVIVTGAGTPPSTMSRAVAAGARGFLIKPYSPTDVLDTIKEALDVARAVSQQVQRPSQERSRGRIIAVYSPKGGVGSTTVAANLAVALAARQKTKVALVDLDLQFGDVGTVLDLHGANSLAEVVGHDDLTDDLIDETFVAHPSGVRTLLAPDNLQVVETIDPEQVTRLLSQLRAHFDFVVADLWSSYESLTIGVLRSADTIIVVTTPELPALRDIQRFVRAVESDAQIAEKLVIVANRYPGRAGLSKDDMTKALGRAILATIPSEGISVTDAINRGLSLLDSRARVRLARQYHELAAIVAERVSAKPVVARDRMNEVPR